MPVLRRHVDRIFLALLVLDTGVTGLALADFGLSTGHREQVSLFFDQNGVREIVLGVVALKFLSTAGLLVGMARRHAPVAGPSRSFLLFAAAAFLGLAGWLGQKAMVAAASLASAPLPYSLLLPAAALILLLLLAGRSWHRLWRFYQQESLIVLAGGWVLLFGSVGLEILGEIFPSGRHGHLVESALEKFCLLTGASILLYGVLRFALRKERLNGLLRPVRC